MNKTIAAVVFYFAVSVTNAVNECNWPTSWHDITWLTSVIPGTKNANLIEYKADKSFVTFSSNDLNTQLSAYNCPAYQTLDGAEVYLRALLGKQNTNEGLCIEEKIQGSVLVSREGGIVPNLGICLTAANASQLYNIYLPVDLNKMYGETFMYGTTWSIRTKAACPMVTGRYAISCTLPGGQACTGGSVTVNTEYMAMLVNEYAMFPDLPLTGSIHCWSTLNSEALGEPVENDDILLAQWSTNSQANLARFYCVRYRRLSSGSWSLSFDYMDPFKLQCHRGMTHTSNGYVNNRKYFNIVMNPTFSESSTLSMSSSTSTTTTTAKTTSTSTTMVKTTSITTTPVAVSLWHVQVVFLLDYNDYTSSPVDKNELNGLVTITDFDKSSIKNVHFESGTGQTTMVTFDIENTPLNIQKFEDHLRNFINKGLTFTLRGSNFQLSEKIMKWTGASNCPDVTCLTGSQCWNRQGDYSCECFVNNKMLRCPSKVTTADDVANKNLIITVSVATVAAVLVIVAIIVIVVVVRLRRRKHKDDNVSVTNSMGSLEEQDRNMYSSIGKKPTAFHDKSFIVDDDEGYGEKTGIQTVGYM